MPMPSSGATFPYPDELNDAQREAVLHPGGPLLVFAGAGSGKTRVITYRIAHLVHQGVPPHRIFAVTFTNKAANEMKERIQRLLGGSAQGLWIGTFHALCSRMLRENGHTIGLSRNFVIFDEDDQVSLIREILKAKNWEDRSLSPRAILNEISRAKEKLLTPDEYAVLDEGYRFLRRVEHRLQLLFDLQTHRLPTSTDELRLLARRMGYKPRSDATNPPRPASRTPRSLLDDAPPVVIDTRHLLVDPLDAFLHDLHEKTRLNRQVLDHLLHGTFSDSSDPQGPETDLVLDPEPPPSLIHSVMERYRFRDSEAAYRNLCRLAEESVPFLSTPRCRHFLASVAPALLRALGQTPDPDQTLNNLERVTASLGAKAVLWELFRFSPPSLQLTIDLCSGSQFLTDILINNPGMIDDLLDSLVLNRPRSRAELDAELTELCRGASDLEPIWHSFQDKEWLRIGVGDLLGKTPIRETTAALSDLAEALLTQVVRHLSRQLPTAVPFVILGLGKLGGREMNYHSDLDLILLYDDTSGDHLPVLT
ncbi:MAG: UvrD-helicase domain-containing protein, partial [Fimbriimonadales bacterium]|nr:UvrD-helicase domain-containing protein [Fimbriimonadales bacterium]